MISVKEMLQLSALSNLVVVAGENGLDRMVSTVSVMDALDIYKWMKGGEFLITSGSPVKDNPGYLCDLIKRLDENGASAFGIKTTRFIGCLPKEVIDIANELKFPVISIPDEYAFTDIINPVLNEVINKQANELRFSEQIHDAFTNLALREESIEKIIETLAEIIERECGFLYLQLNKMYFSNKEGELYKNLSNIDLRAESFMDFQLKYDTHVISNATTTYGLIILGKGKGVSIRNQNIALQHAGTVLILNIQKRISNDQIASKFRDEFIHDIIYNNITTEKELHNRASLYNWNLKNGGVVAIIDIDYFKKNYIKNIDKEKNLYLENSMNMLYRSIIKIIKSEYGQVLYSKLNDYFVFIISENNKGPIDNIKLTTTFDEIRKEVKYKMNITVTTAIGEYKDNSMKLHESYREARRCITISHNLNQSNQIIFYEKLGIYKLINLVIDSKETKELLDRYIYTLITHDEKFNSNLLSTLISICENAWNLRLTSKYMYVHYNTIKYRYKKICEILNTDFSTMDERVTIEVAIKLYQLKK